MVEFKLPDEPPESKLLFEVCSVDGCDSARVVEGDDDTVWNTNGKSYLWRYKNFFRVRMVGPCDRHTQNSK
ncbi:MAG: hypothetical protein M1352_01595 [Patescibacteria group bacterium]|nr:hypothetical protein [Patescibacteria group bacterium]